MGKQKHSTPTLTIKCDQSANEPLLIFTNAWSYNRSADILADQEHKSLFLFTSHVCQSLALELYVKCLREVRRLPAIKKHGIPALLDGVSDDDINAINRHLFNSVSQHPSYVEFVRMGVDFDLHSIAQRTTDTFERIRYWHELLVPTTDAKGYAGNPGLGGLCDAFRLHLIELHPDWPEKVENLRIKPFDNRPAS